MKWLVIVLAVTMAQGCDSLGAGPTLPTGGRWVSFSTVSAEGPFVVAEGIVAATSMAEVEADVVAFETRGRPGFSPDQACPATCWRPVRADEPGLLYLAVATFPSGCDLTVTEGVAIAGSTLYFIHWVGGPNGSRCDTIAGGRWRLVSVSLRDLPGAGPLTVRLQLQGSDGTSNVGESQVEVP